MYTNHLKKKKKKIGENRITKSTCDHVHNNVQIPSHYRYDCFTKRKQSQKCTWGIGVSNTDIRSFAQCSRYDNIAIVRAYHSSAPKQHPTSDHVHHVKPKPVQSDRAVDRFWPRKHVTAERTYTVRPGQQHRSQNVRLHFKPFCCCRSAHDTTRLGLVFVLFIALFLVR